MRICGLCREYVTYIGGAWVSPYSPGGLVTKPAAKPSPSQVALRESSETSAGVAPERFLKPPPPTLLSLKPPKATQGDLSHPNTPQHSPNITLQHPKEGGAYLLGDLGPVLGSLGPGLVRSWGDLGGLGAASSPPAVPSLTGPALSIASSGRHGNREVYWSQRL